MNKIFFLMLLPVVIIAQKNYSQKLITRPLLSEFTFDERIRLYVSDSTRNLLSVFKKENSMMNLRKCHKPHKKDMNARCMGIGFPLSGRIILAPAEDSYGWRTQWGNAFRGISVPF